MTALDARRRAERCLAVARSTTHDGERQAALGRAEAILAPHGLTVADLAKPPPLRGVTFTLVSVDVASFQEALRRFEEAIRDVSRTVGAQEGETIYDARRRNFDAACAAAIERDLRRVKGAP